jgi:hypothetical protein
MGDNRRLHPVGALELGEDPADVYLGGALADVHVLGDL